MAEQQTQVPSSGKKPVLAMGAILAALQVITSGAALADLIGQQAFAMLVLVIAAVQVGWAFYTTGQVTPWADVAAKQLPGGAVIAGPASPIETGTRVIVVTPETPAAAAPPPEEPPPPTYPGPTPG